MIRYTILFCCSIFCLFQLSAQCGNPDASIWEDTWRSCQVKKSPNNARANSHWILYDLGKPYGLGSTRIWNSNQFGQTNIGFKNIIVDYSNNGRTWMELGQYKLSEGTGEAVYSGMEAFHFEGREVRYVLITAIDNWGADECYGLAEVKFNLASKSNPDADIKTSVPAIEKPGFDFTLFPNPTHRHVQLKVTSEIPEQTTIRISDLMGRTVYRTSTQLQAGINTLEISLDDYSSGIYFVTLFRRSKGSKTKRLIRQ